MESETTSAPPDSLRELTTSGEQRECFLEFLSSARYRVDILSRVLDPAIFDDSAVSTGLRDFVLQSKRARVRLLLRDSSTVVRRGHRVVSLIQRLPTYFEVKTLAREHLDTNWACVLFDDGPWIYRTFADRFEGSASNDDLVRHRELTRQFDDLWEAGRLDTQFRRLQL